MTLRRVVAALTCLVIGLILPGTAPLHSAALAAPPPAEDSLAALQALDTRVHAIGWRLIEGNALLCEQSINATGLLVGDVRAYGDPAAVQARLGLGEAELFVATVAPGSPAAEKGLVQGMALDSLGETHLASLNWDKTRSWARRDSVQAMLDNADDTPRSVTSGDKQVMLAPVQVCASTFEVLSRGDSASANGRRVAVGRDFAPVGYAEDELAAALAHELAHNILRHPQWLDQHGRKRAAVRETEREADLLALWLLANAGYDPGAMGRLLARWGPDHDGGLLRKRTHDSWQARARRVEAELAVLRAAEQDKTGRRDWRAHFTPRATR